MFSNDTIDTAVIPAIVLKNMIPLPNNEIKIETSNSRFVEAVKAATSTDRYIAILIHKNPLDDDMTLKNIHPIGIVAKVINVMDGNPFVARVLGIVRCRLIDITTVDPYIHATVMSMPKTSESTTEELNYVKMLVNEIEKNGTKIFGNNREALALISKGVTPDKLTDILAFNMHIDLMAKMKYLDTPSITQRLRFIVEDVKREKVFAELDVKIEEDVRKSISESQKEYYLREKMRAIQNELGDKAKKETDVEEMRAKILEAKMPKDIEQKALNELNRYAYLNASSGESAISKNYLDFMISLPWSKEGIKL